MVLWSGDRLSNGGIMVVTFSRRALSHSPRNTTRSRPQMMKTKKNSNNNDQQQQQQTSSSSPSSSSSPKTTTTKTTTTLSTTTTAATTTTMTMTTTTIDNHNLPYTLNPRWLTNEEYIMNNSSHATMPGPAPSRSLTATLVGTSMDNLIRCS